MQSRGIILASLLLLPALSGCTVPWFDRLERWDLELPLGILVPQRLGEVVSDVDAAAELAARQLNAHEVGIRYTITKDTARDNPNAAFDRLVAKGAAVVVAAVAPEDAKALAQRAAAKKVPLLLATPPAGSFTNAEAAYVLAVAPPPAHEGRALADLVTREGVRSVVVFQTTDVFTQGLAQAFDAAYAGDIVANVTFTPDQHGAIINAARDACARGAGGAVLLAQAAEAGWIVRGLAEGGCRDRLAIFAASSARQDDLVFEAGVDGNDRPYAGGVRGVEPAGARLAEFRALFDAEYGRSPEFGAAPAYDAVTYASLAAFASKSNPRGEPVRAKITAAQVQGDVLDVAEAPGVKHRDIRNAIRVVKVGDDIDWVGYAHDHDFSDARLPLADAFGTWRVTPTGGVESDR